MQYRTLGNTGIEVSAVAFGCWAIVGGFNWGPQDESDSIAALRAAREAGVTFFDTAEAYGDGYSEQLVGKALGGVRDEIVIASKVSPDHYAPDALRAACERSLRNLATDRIDLYQLHWPHREIPVAETLGVLEQLKAEGKIRAFGVSNFGRPDLAGCLATRHRVASNQLAYSLLFRAIEFEILPLCVQEGISVLCYSPMLQGLLTGKFASADDVPLDRARTRHFSREREHTRHGEPGAEAETFAAIAEIRRIAEGLGEPMARVALAWLLAQKGVAAAEAAEARLRPQTGERPARNTSSDAGGSPAAVIAGGRSPEQARANAQAADLVLPQDAIARLSAATDTLKRKLGPNADMWQSESRIRQG